MWPLILGGLNPLDMGVQRMGTENAHAANSSASSNILLLPTGTIVFSVPQVKGGIQGQKWHFKALGPGPQSKMKCIIKRGTNIRTL